MTTSFAFNQKGEWIGEFGGRQKAPLKLMNCHKIFIDHRYAEPRILLCDRLNNRLVHTTLDGELIKVYATKLRKPSSAAAATSPAMSMTAGKSSITTHCQEEARRQKQKNSAPSMSSLT